jgi:uncharacterized membrane protein
MSTETIWVIIWLIGFIANIITVIIEGVPEDYPGHKAEHYFGAVILSCLSWVLFIVWLFTRIIGEPDEKENY